MKESLYDVIFASDINEFNIRICDIIHTNEILQSLQLLVVFGQEYNRCFSFCSVVFLETVSYIKQSEISSHF